MSGEKATDVALDTFSERLQRHRQPAVSCAVKHFFPQLPGMINARLTRRYQPVDAQGSRGKEEQGRRQCVCILHFSPMLGAPSLLDK